MIDDISEIEILIRARYPIIWIESFEEQRVIRQLNEIAITRQKQLILWSGTTGLINIEGDSVSDGAKDPIKALDFIETIETPTIVVYKDLHRYIEDIRVYRKVRDLHTILKGTMNTLIILSPVVTIPVELQKSISIVSVPLPTADNLDEVLTHVVACTSAGAEENTDICEVVSLIEEELKTNKDEILNAGLGLTEDEFENVISRSIVEERKLDPRIIIGEKEQIIKKSGLLEFQTNVVGMDQVGGLNILKDWIMKRKQAYTPEAKEYGLPVPKGVFITGPPGTGKSLTAKAAAAYLGVPLLRLDISKIFGSFVGQSEQNMSHALQLASAVAPCVLWLDEIEKAMAGVQSSGTNDSGVTARVFSGFLVWLQERESHVFVVATCNNPLSIPPEIYRSGRFDEVFFVNLPSEEERASIFEIHINAVKRDPAKYDLKLFAKKSKGYSGAEIQGVIHEALYNSFFNDTNLDEQEIFNAIDKMVPLSKKRESELNQLITWGRSNALSASSVGKTNILARGAVGPEVG